MLGWSDCIQFLCRLSSSPATSLTPSNRMAGRPHGGISSSSTSHQARLAATHNCLAGMRLVTLEADLQNLAVVADEPSGFRIRKSDRPVTAHLWQFEPGLSFVGSPSGRAGVEVRLGLGRDHNGPVVSVAEVVLMVPIIVVFKATHIGE